MLEDRPAGYEWVAPEGASMTFDVPTDLAYGAKGMFVYRNGVTGYVAFDNATFSDPIPGVGKSGYARRAGAQLSVRMVLVAALVAIGLWWFFLRRK